MLSHDERRELAHIERHLRASDPSFAARMRDGGRRRRVDGSVGWPLLGLALLLLASVAGAILATVAVTLAAVIALRCAIRPPGAYGAP